ncbi:undecaprenyldiphospho-muramoylpentapeptide beta-N-acetylglucosaminyltransferase [Litorilituus lipolyticus]|uniref:UDP-N-acetylglucosamine--N-acetylmuramyl-(pentapeptide) pyrophosphoryl-undecaprenol N-acetylglucosamine transferase n=1 Tax=Litorilituus lipolyticus TaxID=2491017 RepID=A0A502KKU4_9GAMM|nr:undecaprenyldiphospho-muramoylpentapeptide beta-N-acetylglucosaminyltransferase [Litorilituus lipolyticus]TPH12036.1 undecaprenyldiphospho-muramoylpentapeptide beta-N-acetylglucosaminyltransferase [Litorilituus lipolyticus]
MTLNTAPTLLVMAGGTGGHIFPGLAVAQLLASRGWHIHWLGTAERMEADIVPNHGFDISFIDIKGARNKGVKTLLLMPFSLVKSIWQAMRVIRKTKPDVVLGMGGYASGPGGLAAWLLRRPVIVHEQNAAAGLTNRLLAGIATIVCSAFPGAFKQSKKTVQVVGNPLRANITQVSQQDSEDTAKEKTNNDEQRRILVVGGSLGAQVLNNTVPKAFSLLTKDDERYSIWHQTGKGNARSVEAQYDEQFITDGSVKVTEFIDDMAAAYQWADIVICRAGALTVSELAMAAKPAIFVPLPHAVDDHQSKNAQFLVNKGGAKLIAQQAFNAEKLAQTLTALFVDKKILKTMAVAASKAADKQSTEKVADLCQQLVKTK